VWSLLSRSIWHGLVVPLMPDVVYPDTDLFRASWNVHEEYAEAVCRAIERFLAARAPTYRE
jgi:hypothetical protein